MLDGYKIIKSINTKDDFLRALEPYGTLIYQKDDVNNLGAVEISTRLGINKYAYKKLGLFPHTDRSSELVPPRYVAIWYEKMADYGGEPIIFLANKVFSNDNLENFKAYFTSENDQLANLYSFYDQDSNFFRFRNDDHIYLSASTIAKFERVVQLIKDNQVTLNLESKDCLIIDNWNIFHGRTAFTGERIIHRALIQ
ncbi:TauD/TfdA family dioxygenase [Thiotrichales bacterium 19S3-7]|nr:TauD/TfdA family dioxygenase [Thiotrichales bacterium 19S3-7]MCF6802806.1 TauD/TfdA family dioxygenase [Thiotrichales bacterium 19S3-11]